jgi:hypothetical protein
MFSVWVCSACTAMSGPSDSGAPSGKSNISVYGVVDEGVVLKR